MNTANDSQAKGFAGNRSTDALTHLDPVQVTEQQPLSQHDAPLKLQYSLSTMILCGTICAVGFTFGFLLALTLA